MSSRESAGPSGAGASDAGGSEAGRSGGGASGVLGSVLTGVVASITGYASSFVLLLAGARAVGATAEQASSGLLVVCVVQGATAIVLSLAHRIPISVAWSTPAAAVLAGAAAVTRDYGAAVAAFVATAILLVATGLWPWLARTMTRIPPPIASAMLAGILFPICLSPVLAAVRLPLYALPAIVVWLVLTRVAPRWAVPGAVVATAIAVVVAAGPDWIRGARIAPGIQLVPLHPEPLVIVALAVPLYLVTMAGQNIPGFTVLRTYGYPVPARSVLVGTGLASVIVAPFGGQTVNLSALSAAIVVGDPHTPKDRRWIGTVTVGAVYIVLGLFSGVAAALVKASPPILIESAAGLALLGAFVAAVAGALEDPGPPALGVGTSRIVAAGTFVTVASGIVVAGLGSAFWGLVVGAVLWLVLRVRRRPESPAPVAR